MTPKLLMTRPQAQATRFVDDLRAAVTQPFEVILSPLIDIVPVPVDGDIDTPDHLIFTSINAVKQVSRLGLKPTAIAWCVGGRTAQAARDAGFEARSADGSARDLVALIQAQVPDGNMLHLHGRHTHMNFADVLGDQCTSLCVYDQVAVPLSQLARQTLKGTEPVIVPLFSPRSASILLQDSTITAPTHFVGISAQTAQIVVGHPPWQIAKTPDHAGMIDATKRVIDAL